MAYKGKDEGLIFLEQTLESINKEHGTNYSFHWAVLNAADYGVPQIRERVFIIGSRDGREFSFPPPRFSKQDTDQISLFNQLPTYRTAWDAIGDLETKDDDPTVSSVGAHGHESPPRRPENH